VGQVFLKTLKPVVPEPLVLRDPVPHRAELFGDEVVAALTAVPLLGYETGIEQYAKVLRDGRATHPEVPREGFHGVIGFREQVEQQPPRGVADRREYIRVFVGCRNHAASIGK
jgi:hypothetical protein